MSFSKLVSLIDADVECLLRWSTAFMFFDATQRNMECHLSLNEFMLINLRLFPRKPYPVREIDED